MPKMYDRNCDYCGEHYRKYAKRFCSCDCSARYSSEHPNKGAFSMGSVPSNKKPPEYKKCIACGSEFLVQTSNPKTKCCSVECGHKTLKGVPKSREHRENISKNNARYWLGKSNPSSSATAKKYLKQYQSGENHWNWKGGITPKLKSLRMTKQYRKWVKDVFERDNWTCQECGVRGGKLQAHHHIETFAEIVNNNELHKLSDISFGITLCRSCHIKTDNYARRFSGSKEWTEALK